MVPLSPPTSGVALPSAEPSLKSGMMTGHPSHAPAVWGLASLECSDRVDLVRSIGRYALERLSKYKPQEISNTCWALATLDVHIPELMDAIASVRLPRLLVMLLTRPAHAFMCFQNK